MGNFVKSNILIFTLVFISKCYCQELAITDSSYLQPTLIYNAGSEVSADFITFQTGILMLQKNTKTFQNIELCSFEYKITRENKIILSNKNYGAYFSPEFKRTIKILQTNDTLIFYNFEVIKNGISYSKKINPIKFLINKPIYKISEYDSIITEKLNKNEKWNKITKYYGNMCAIDQSLLFSRLGVSKDSSYSSIEYGLMSPKETTNYEFRYYIKTKDIKVYSSNTNKEYTFEEWEKNLKE